MRGEDPGGIDKEKGEKGMKDNEGRGSRRDR
jgi:hypothetical protein